MQTLCFILAITIGTISLYASVACITAAAGHSSESEPVIIQLRWSHQFQFAGYYAAVEKGYYADEGLEVTLAEATTGTDRINPVLEGQADAVAGYLSHEPHQYRQEEIFKDLLDILNQRLGGCPTMAFSQTLRNFQKIMLAISSIWLCLFFENLSILTKTPILGQPPRYRFYHCHR